MTDKEKVTKVAKELAQKIGPQNVRKAEIATLTGINLTRWHDIMGETFLQFLGSLPLISECGIRGNRLSLPAHRRRQILDACITYSKVHGFRYLTIARASVAAGVSRGLIVKYFKSNETLQDAVIEFAVEREHIGVIAQGLACEHPTALECDSSIRIKCGHYVAQR